MRKSGLARSFSFPLPFSILRWCGIAQAGISGRDKKTASIACRFFCD
jgi:hypothetical protein